MKKLFILIVLFASISAMGQSSYYRRSQGPSFKGVGMGAGLFFPKLDYYKNKTGYEFDPAIATQINGEVSLKYPLSARVGVGYSRTRGTQTQIISEEEWSEVRNLTLVPFTADLLINYSLGGSRRPSKFRHKSFALDVYGGAGIGYNLLFLNYHSTDGGAKGETKKNNGSTYTVHGILGVQYPINALKIGIEGQYDFGNYAQTFVSPNGNESLETVSINGPKVMLTLSYNLSSKNRYSRGRSGYSKRGNRSYKSNKKRKARRR